LDINSEAGVMTYLGSVKASNFQVLYRKSEQEEGIGSEPYGKKHVLLVFRKRPQDMGFGAMNFF
jgi:hypothetical protein